MSENAKGKGRKALKITLISGGSLLAVLILLVAVFLGIMDYRSEPYRLFRDDMKKPERRMTAFPARFILSSKGKIFSLCGISHVVT